MITCMDDGDPTRSPAFHCDGVGKLCFPKMKQRLARACKLPGSRISRLPEKGAVVVWVPGQTNASYMRSGHLLLNTFRGTTDAVSSRVPDISPHIPCSTHSLRVLDFWQLKI